MTALEFMKARGDAEVEALAMRCGTTLAYFKQIAYRHRRPSVDLARKLAAESGGALDAADALNKLQQRTGLATEFLSQLQYAAKLADVSNESLATSMRKLNVSIAQGLAGDKEKIAALMSDVEKQRGEKAKADRKAGPKEPAAEAVPMGSYNPGPIDLSSDLSVEVYTNHSMKLPLDPRVFAAHVLPQIQVGKFERGLARKMPAVLPKQARALEIGSAVGFLAGHCANIRTDIHFTLQEDDSSLRQMMQVV